MAVEKKFSLKHVIKNFPQLIEEYSEQEEHFGKPWRIRCHKLDGKFSLYLRCERKSDETSPWTIDTSFRMNMVAVSGKNDISKETTNQFTDAANGWGWPKYLSWDSVISDHMTNNCVTIECHVTIKKIDGLAAERKISFDEPMKNMMDVVVLKIGEQKFNVLKSLLAFRSPYFDTLFFGNFSESNESEVELKEVDADDFQSLLDTIYGESVIQAENVEGVLKLADQFDVAMVRDKCEEFLVQTGGIGGRTKLRLADEYELENLKKNCLDAMNSMEGIINSTPSDLARLNHSTVLALLEKSFNLHKT